MNSSSSLSALQSNVQGECARNAVVLTDINYSYGSINWFYDIAQGLCRKMQAELSDEYMQQLADITKLNSTDSLQSSAGYFLKKQSKLTLLAVLIS
ncbi:unnamed protein product [Gongylonema pulchrum]|uniref:C-type lectin domain-containing protein n=1 Tax=Gongylonema pulchrum TaxID=637853 RepID=A0A183EVU8_9BILA|nr:unnamed protein product [Gongylonema pulchrum]